MLGAAAPAAARGPVELVVTLRPPALAVAVQHDRALASVTVRGSRVDLRSPASISYMQLLEREQTTVVRRIARAIPGSFVRWRYTVTLDGFAVVLPPGRVAALARVAGVAKVWPTTTFQAALDRTPQLIGAPTLWGPTLATAGQGMKIGIIDEGVDQTHSFFDPSGYTMPPGFPKGDASFTTAKVIVARAFAPAKPTWKYANLPFDPENSEHGTHVAGIAAGDHGTKAMAFPGQPVLSGVAPAAYIGNYKALTIPTPGFGLDGNAPEITAAIEQAVKDGMDVINLSLGEPEIEQSRDVVVAAIDGAADAGVVPVIAAGNDFDSFGKGSIGSPGNAPKAITVAASTSGRGFPADLIAPFSSGGPTPYSLQFKPNVTAPGVNVLSSVPQRDGTWAVFNGTSMATPHVAGAAALLRQQHPSWTVAQIRAALEETGATVYADTARSVETSPLREGGGRIDLAKANAPLFFAEPPFVSFGLLRGAASHDLQLTDAGGGAGAWQVRASDPCGLVSAPAAVTVPGTLTVSAATPPAGNGDCAGFIVLTRGSDTRRIPFWLGYESPHLGAPTRTLTKNGTYAGNAAAGSANVDRYRYPDPPTVLNLTGPEQVFAFKLTRPVANFGARVVSLANGASVTPRLVRDDDENRLAGYTGLPADLNPYRELFGRNVPVVAAILPAPGTYDIVFDTVNRAEAGKFTFRFWINDTTPPKVKFKSYKRGVITLTATDAGSGVDPAAITTVVDGQNRTRAYRNGRIEISVGSLSPGKHRVSVTVGDYQEAKNMEDVGPILPNTRTYSASFKVR